MKKVKKVLKAIILAAPLLLLIISCSKQPQASSAADNYLNYGFNTEGANKYVSSSNINQLIIAGGQEVAADVQSIVSYSVTRTGEENDKLKLRIHVDSIYTVVSSMQGNMVSKPESVMDKEFQMLLSMKGEESGLEEAAKIEYSGISGETANLKSTFSMIFPDLPGDIAEVGYTWTDNDTIDMSISGQTVLMIINSNNTIVAREKYMGYNCYRIEYTNTGERNASGDTPQGYMTSSGDISGKGYLLFAYKEGLVVKDSSEQKFDGDLTLPTGDAFPMYMDIKIDVSLVK